MTRLKVAILFGGASEEHPVSVKSAQEVARHLDPDAYEPIFVGITRYGDWRLCDGPGPDWERGRHRPVSLSPDRGAPGLILLEEGGHRLLPVDVVLPVLHGRYGEDGAVQGLLEISGIPYAGCDIAGSALCMDKSLAYAVAGAAGIPTPVFRIATADEQPAADALEYPVFVKPARSGSSFGVSRVDRADDLAAAIADARRYDTQVLIEQAVSGREVGCAVLEDGTETILGEVDEIRLSHGFFRIHQEDRPEVRSENSAVVVPAGISEEERQRVQETARRIYRALRCTGLARVDMFLTDDGEVVLNEVNTLPGLTSYSRYPRMMAAAGLSLGDVLDRMIAYARNGRTR